MDKLYTIIEVATKLGLSDKTLRRWEEAGRFTPSRTLGNQRRYTLEDLQILDALKHGIFESQRDLLTIEQAAKLAGVSPTSILRWENEGKIHPFITSGNTYYPRQKLVEKMDELKRTYVEPIQPPLPKPTPSVREFIAPPTPTSAPTNSPRLTPLSAPLTSPTPNHINFRSTILNALITILLLISYHLLFNPSRTQTLKSPSTGSVQGAVAPDPRLDLLDKYFTKAGGLTISSLSLLPSSVPTVGSPGLLYYDADSNSIKIYKNGNWTELSSSQNLELKNANLISGSSVLSKGKDQASVTDPKITSKSVITVTFANDYAPAKKYWVTPADGAFTLHTDFPMSEDSKFNYYLIVN